MSEEIFDFNIGVTDYHKKYDKFWVREEVICEFFCIRNKGGDPYGSDFPETECTVHWNPEFRWFRDEFHRARREYILRLRFLEKLANGQVPNLP